MHLFLSVANQYKPNHSRSTARNILLGKLIGGYCFQIHTLNEVEDESHMLFKCPILYETERATLLIYIQDNCENFEHLSPNNKFIWLLSSEDTLL